MKGARDVFKEQQTTALRDGILKGKIEEKFRQCHAMASWINSQLVEEKIFLIKYISRSDSYAKPHDNCDFPFSALKPCGKGPMTVFQKLSNKS
ncbi:hypothetical protein T4E_6007 [Trichinella pseudospiralis]|uniref:Uncharacterized protein n=1 Tax=Trichinella pseudospiralis TaxID=6337 RepID=A0A0V0YBN5_TRIPS|nr:hypothetical protein T4E_6007 [Trichinella pseudospiralis]